MQLRGLELGGMGMAGWCPATTEQPAAAHKNSDYLNQTKIWPSETKIRNISFKKK